MARRGRLVVAYSSLTAAAITVGTHCQVEICPPLGEAIAEALDDKPGPADPPWLVVQLTTVASSTAATSSLDRP